MAAIEAPERTHKLCRAMPAHYEVKDTVSGPPRLFGHFVIWDEWTEISSMLEGHFFERFAVGSWDKTIRENASRMRCLFQHGEDPQLGRKVIGPIEILEADETGVYYEVPLFTSIPDLIMEGLRAGVYGSSTIFDVIKWNRVTRPTRSDRNPEGIEERTITEARGVEFGPCVFNLYEGATATARSETDSYVLRKLVQDPAKLRQIAKDAGIELEEKKKPLVSTAFVPVNYTTGTTTGTAPLATTLVSQSITPSEAPAVTRRYQRAAERVGEMSWAVLPKTLETILGIIQERQRGYKPSQEEIAERIGDGRPDPASGTTGRTAVIPVGGTIMPHAASFSSVSQKGTSVEGLQEMFRSAMNDPEIDAIVFNIDSPGGAVDLVPEFGQEIMDARGSKPITAIANTMAASAAYWLACCCDEIVVTPSGKVGSIGVYSAHQDMSEKYAAEGVKTTLVSAGENKTQGNPFEPLSEKAMGQMQKTVDTYYGMFVEAVATGRGVDTETVLSDFGQGLMYTAQDAVKAGLADRVGTYDDVVGGLPAVEDEGMMQVAEEPVAPVVTTPVEPEPSVATTRDRAAKQPLIYGQRVEDSWNLGSSTA